MRTCDLTRKQWKAFYRAGQHAAGVVMQARRCGVLTNLKHAAIICVDCGAKATVYDHRDYRRPLDVVPVCHRCNLLRGPANLEPFISGETLDIEGWAGSFPNRLWCTFTSVNRTQSAQTP